MIRPLGNRVLIERAPKEEKKGSILLMEASTVETNKGTVIAFGPEVKHLSIGDMVLFDHYSYTLIDYQDKPYLLIEEKNVLAVL